MLFLKKHYEKILLGVLLTIFIGLLVFQFLLWQQGQQIKIDGILGFTPPPPNYTSIDFEAQDSPFNVLANLRKPRSGSNRKKEGHRRRISLISCSLIKWLSALIAGK
ncbi:MAG: hypothetical protein J6M38_09925 [Lentisphaeria bacterium]|nr:hypothetical protein [Lentisphaeria bacterium]